MECILYTNCVKSQEYVHKKLNDSYPSGGYSAAMALSSYYKEESGRRLKFARNTKGLTLRTLAAETDLAVSRISNYEQGERYMDPDAAHKLARSLGVRASWLMVIDDSDTMTQDERILIDKYRRTDDRGKKSIQSIACTQPEVKPPSGDDYPTSSTLGRRTKKRTPNWAINE